MTMKLTQLITYWDASDAKIVIEFLDELRDVLLTTYHDDIKERHQTMIDNQPDPHDKKDSDNEGIL